MSFTSAAIVPCSVDRALFSSSTASRDQLLERRVDLQQLLRRLRTHVDVHEHVDRNRVDRRAAADDADVEGGFRLGRHLHARELRDGVAHGQEGLTMPNAP